MIRRQIWRPDTCSCVITQEWNDSLPDDQIVVTNVDVVPCDYHKNFTTKGEAMVAVHGENVGKNQKVDELIKTFVNPSEEVIRQSVEKYIKWYRDKDKKIVVEKI